MLFFLIKKAPIYIYIYTSLLTPMHVIFSFETKMII